MKRMKLITFLSTPPDFLLQGNVARISSRGGGIKYAQRVSTKLAKAGTRRLAPFSPLPYPLRPSRLEAGTPAGCSISFQPENRPISQETRRFSLAGETGRGGQQQIVPGAS